MLASGARILKVWNTAQATGMPPPILGVTLNVIHVHTTMPPPLV
jgi:hypothetical protein